MLPREDYHRSSRHDRPRIESFFDTIPRRLHFPTTNSIFLLDPHAVSSCTVCYLAFTLSPNASLPPHVHHLNPTTTKFTLPVTLHVKYSRITRVSQSINQSHLSPRAFCMPRINCEPHCQTCQSQSRKKAARHMIACMHAVLISDPLFSLWFGCFADHYTFFRVLLTSLWVCAIGKGLALPPLIVAGRRVRFGKGTFCGGVGSAFDRLDRRGDRWSYGG
jgi:hypothetical protein